VTWIDLLEYGPGWAACILMPLSWYYQAKWAREERHRPRARTTKRSRHV
jgi:hypothetical protein